jgi:outer membrane receptor protein involved in Fe transport
VEAVDFELDWRVALSSAGTFRIYGRATWQPKLKLQTAEGEKSFNAAGDADGPLAWRGYGGLAWTRNATSIGLNVQYFGSYSASYSDPDFASRNDRILKFQGKNWIGPQVFVDLNLRQQINSSLEMAVGIINVLDQSPAIEADPARTFGYSYYGDPRRRRFELSVSAGF